MHREKFLDIQGRLNMKEWMENDRMVDVFQIDSISYRILWFLLYASGFYSEIFATEALLEICNNTW